jgi:hypothetical protein
MPLNLGTHLGIIANFSSSDEKYGVRALRELLRITTLAAADSTKNERDHE